MERKIKRRRMKSWINNNAKSHNMISEIMMLDKTSMRF